MSTEKTSSGSYGVKLVAGLLFMFGGTYVALKVTPSIEALHDLAKQGIPLDPGRTLAAIGVLLILFPVVESFFVTPLKNAINERNADLERTFSEAEELRAELQQMRANYEQRLVATEAQAREQIQSQIREAQQLRQTLMAEAAERADALVERAHQEISAERDKVLTDLRLQVTDLALVAAERVIGANLDNDANRRLVDDFINQVEVAH